MSSSENIMDYLAKVAPYIPFPMYWTNLEPRVLGANEACLAAMGAKTIDDVVGKTPHDYYPREIADDISSHILLVSRTRKVLTQEDMIQDISSGKTRYYAAIRSPLFGSDGEVVGVFGTSIEITAEKESELLKIENERQKILADEQERFKKTADQVAHDIRSPLASLLMIVRACQNMQETERVALRDAANRINDIANNLISSFRKKEVEQTSIIEKSESVLASPILLQILAEKKYEIQNAKVKIDHHFSQTGNFAWFITQPAAFTRMLSNIINNSVDSFDQKEGNITVHLDANNEHVCIAIEDNGKGMSPELVQKILNQIAVTEGKSNGHGIGLTQVRDALEANQGQWEIDSRVGVGTKIKLTFPRAKAMSWIAEVVELRPHDTVVILDDDSSIHMAWDFRFEKILQEHSGLRLKHFEIGQEAVDFINDLNPDKKKQIFLLADYELLNQNLNGLDVIALTHIDRSILVTSHYANKEVQRSANKTATKILPKRLASEVAIQVEEVHDDRNAGMPNSGFKNVDVIFVDDEQYLLDGFKFFATGKLVDTFCKPEEFLSKANNYHKRTKIMLDQNFANSELKGTQIAEHLHAMGFSCLYLMSGESFSDINLPGYLTGIQKSNLDALTAALDE